MSMDGSKAIMAGLEKQLSNVLDAFNGRARKLTTEEKVQAFYAHSMGNDESKLEKLLKPGVSLEQAKQRIHQTVVDLIKEDEQPDWQSQAKELFALLKSDQAERVKAKIEQSGGAAKDILDGVLQKALDEYGNHLDEYGHHNARQQYCLDYMVPAIELGANPNLKDKDGWTALMLLAWYVEKPDFIIQMLLDKGADPNLTNKDGTTAMVFVLMCVEQPDTIIQVMLGKGADHNLKNKNVTTAMMVAARYVKQPDAIIQMLLDKGADPMQKSRHNESIVKIAKSNYKNKNKKQTIRLLKDAIKEYKLKQKALKPKRNFLGFKKG